jgi:transcriptional regulator with XRE-family HTH domain
MSITTGELAFLARRERARLGLSVRELADQAGTSASTVSRFERGHETQLSAALSILKALDLSLLEPSNCKHEYACRLCGEAMTP